eukprot:PhM_4_TR2308/c0_g1_i1/m.103187
MTHVHFNRHEVEHQRKEADQRKKRRDEILNRRSEVLCNTPRNPYTDPAPMPGYDMRPWREKENQPQPYPMVSCGMPDYPHWTNVVADSIADKNIGPAYDDVRALPDFEGWEQQKEKKVRVALTRIIERGWYSKDEHKLSDAELRHRNALREHYSMGRHKLTTPVIGANTMPVHEWHVNMNALSVLSHDTSLRSSFKRVCERRRKERGEVDVEIRTSPIGKPYRQSKEDGCPYACTL